MKGFRPIGVIFVNVVHTSEIASIGIYLLFGMERLFQNKMIWNEKKKGTTSEVYKTLIKQKIDSNILSLKTSIQTNCNLI